MNVSITHTEKIGSALWLLLAGGVFFASEDLPAGAGETDAGFYPQVIAVLIAAFALIQFGRSVYDDGVGKYTIRSDQVARVATITLLVTAYVLLLPWLGFIVATVLFLTFGMIYSGARHPLRIGAVSLGMSLLLYYVFAVFLRIPLHQSPFLPVEEFLPGLLSGISYGVI